MNSSIYTPADLEKIYRARFAGSLDYRMRVWQVLCKYFAQWTPADGAVLDIGCGYCEFINQIPAASKYGIDMNPDTEFRAVPEMKLMPQDCSATWGLDANTLNTVFSSNLFEHLPTKAHLEDTLAEAFRCLKPGGHLIALGPNIRYSGGAYWDFYDHHLPLTERSLAEVLRKVGFEIAVEHAQFLPYTMSSGFRYPIWMVQVYLALPLAWRIFGKQFLVVARKPA